ncbi:PhoH family protein [Adlercreutzia sp. ZJ154]|uniref:PhoH family protein n=1 Tax=Adlercreutzia sp. ZJ154 TaxID=2709790 RepID=UPI0013EB5D87|nr:PhoH family protein [Adlercreutzia sp. ZJ154]
MAEIIHTELQIPADVDVASISGHADALLRLIQDSIDARITLRGNVISIEGVSSEVDSATAIFDDMIKNAQSSILLDEQHVRHLIELVRSDALSPSALRKDVLLAHRGHAIRPKTAGQKRYVDAIRNNTITFGIGPAGTGKTYLAMAMAISALKHKEVGRIILSRPIVEAGENLGFLPGTLTEKVDPYIRPLYDALFDMTDPEHTNSLLEQGVIEIAPLAFMRGRTLNDSFIILDEAQNTTPEQMKMFLTRLGFGSKMVITGDETQTDLPTGSSGLLQAKRVLADVDDIEFCAFSGKDVVRNSLVAAIVAAYDKASEE